MNLRLQCGLSILAAMVLFLAPQPDCGAGELPVADVPASGFRFEPVADGQEVLHDFVLANRGEAPLNISKVRTG